MADENTPRDATAKDVLRAAQELKPELQAVRRELAQTGGELRAAKAGEPTVARGGRGGAAGGEPPTTEPGVKKVTDALDDQLRVRTRLKTANIGAANEELAALRAQYDALQRIHALATHSGPSVFPTGRNPYLAGGRPLTGDVTQTQRGMVQVRLEAQAARDALLEEQTIRQRLARIGAVTANFGPRPLQIGGNAGSLVIPAAAAAAQPLIVPPVSTRGSNITPGERARQAELIQELRTRQAIRAEARATQVAVEAEAASIARLLGMLVEEQGFAQRSLAARREAAVAAEKEAAAQARINRERMASDPRLSPGERRLAQAEYLGTPYGPLTGMAGVAPGSEQRPSPFPVHQVNRGPAYEARAAEAEFGAYRSGRTAARDVGALNSELTRLGTVQAAASQQMRKHGALTTEFLTALARGETTVQEFGYQIGATAGKFAGWTAAAGGVYGLLNAFGRLKQGAQDASSGVNVVSRVISNVNTDDAQKAFEDLSRQFNVPVNTAVDAVYRMGQRFHSLPEAVEAAKASLYSFKTGEVDVATSTENLLAIVNGFGLGAKDLAKVYDQINQAQNTFGIRIGDTEAGLAKAAGTYKNAGGDLNYLLAITVAIGRATNRSGQEIGTGISRGVNQIRQAANQEKLKSQGIDVDPENFQKTLQRSLVAAQKPGADLQKIASGLFGNQYARLIAPVLRDQTVLNAAIKDTSPEASKGSAQKELAKVLKQVNEQISALGNGLERIGAEMAQTGVFAGFGGALKLLTLMEATVEHILRLFNDIPSPIRHTLTVMAELYGVMRLMRRTQIGAAAADATGLSFIGPGQAERARREAIVGTRHAEQTAANSFEGAINAATMSKVEARAQRTLAETLRLEASRATNDIEATALRERSNMAMAKYEELQGVAYAQEQLALQYQEAYTTATERRVMLQRRQITAEQALAETQAAMPGGILLDRSVKKKPIVPPTRALTAGEQMEMFPLTWQERSPGPIRAGELPPGPPPIPWQQQSGRVDLGMNRGIDGQLRPPFLIHGPHVPPADLNRWAADNAHGPRVPMPLGETEQLALFGEDVGVQTKGDKLKAATRDASQKIEGRAAKLKGVGREIGEAGKSLGKSVGNFVSSMGVFGLAFGAYLIGDEIKNIIEAATKSIEEQNKSLDKVPHSLEALQNRAAEAKDKAERGAQHGFKTTLGEAVGTAYNFFKNFPDMSEGGRGYVADSQTAADKARADADQAVINARKRTGGRDVSQNVGLANQEIIKAATREANNARAMGESRADVNKAFERYLKDAGVSIEALATGKTSQVTLAAIRKLRAQALTVYGATSDPFAAFRGGLDATTAAIDTMTTRAATYGTSGKDLDQVLRGATFATAKYGASDDPKDVQKVNDAQSKVDAYLTQMTSDLKAANAEIARHGARRASRDITPATLRADASFTQRGTDRNYHTYIQKLQESLGHVYDGFDRVRTGMNEAQRLVNLGESAKAGTLGPQQMLPAGMPTSGRALDRWLTRQKAKLKAEQQHVKEVGDAADRRAEKIREAIDATQQQQYQETQSRIQTRSAYAQSLASDKSGQIAAQLHADGQLVREALAYHGPDRWVKIMEALTQQNNDIATQAQQNLQDIQQAGDLRTSKIIGSGKGFDQRRLQSQLQTATAKLAEARSEKANPGKKDDIAQAEIARNQVLQQISDQAQQDAKDAHDLAMQLYDSRRAITLAGITDPTRKLRYQLETDKHDLGLVKRGDFKTQIEYEIARNQQRAKIRQDQTDLQQQHITDELDTAHFEHNIGKLTDDAYISQLRQIVKMKGITKQTKRQLLEEIHQITEQGAGNLDLNVGSIRLPSIYEIRRAMGGRSQRFGQGGQMVVHSNPTVQINVANSADAMSVGEQVEGVVNGPVRANMRAMGLVG